ncbi:hypothetical protein [Alkalihalobacillus sp. CinArs1]|uniref:hypothetical protein n=1 Tax=Alkalihalobacillus sp. CinArs1 TaxID=2995314 RepID=UPI0022DE6A6C|nr:hypothetical protein [Alkalihalobacillus sp. CinArs1]
MSFKKLDLTKMYNTFKNQYEDVYKFNSTRKFYSKEVIKYEYVALSFSFAYAMAYSEEGYHRRERSGGSKSREDFDVFCDTFLGKLGEYGAYQYLKDNIKDIKLSLPDNTIEGKGKWDSYDLTFEHEKKTRNIGVKTTKHFGQLLMLETEDWDEEGKYIPNKEKEADEYTGFFFVRVSYDLIRNLQGRYFYQEKNISPESFASVLSDAHYNFDIHYIPMEYIKSAIKNEMIVLKDNYLNNLAKANELDANNYYIQCGDMIYQDKILSAMQV